MPTIPTNPKSFFQLGAALIVSMIMLLVVTAIGVAVMDGSHLELLMSNNSYFQTDAYRNAEIALNEGLNNLPTIVNSLGPPDPNDITTWYNGTYGSPVTATIPSGGTARYAVEYISHEVFDLSLTYRGSSLTCSSGSLFCVNSYRVWGYGTDGKGATRLLQETYSFVVNNPAILPWHNITEIH